MIGPLPEGICALHSCDELTHIRPGMPLENSQDMVTRGRARKSRKVA